MPSALLPLLLLACADEPTARTFDLALAELVPSVVQVTLGENAAQADGAWVEYGVDGAFDHVASVELTGDGPQEALLLGMKPDTDVTVRLLTERDGQMDYSEEQVITTGSAPSWLPSLLVEQDDGQEHLGGGLLLTTLVNSPAAVVMLDGDGEFVWWADLSDLGPVARARLSRDGRELLVMPINVEIQEEVPVVRLGLDGERLGETMMPLAHHDFVELEDGTLGALAYDVREVDGLRFVGDAVIEVSPDGAVQTRWSAFDDLDPLALPSGLTNDDWTHGNSLTWDKDQGDWIVTFYGLSAVARVDRKEGLVSLLGTDLGDYEDGNGQPVVFDRLHQGQPLDGGRLLVFENGAGQETASRAVELLLDDATGVAKEQWSYTPSPSLNTFTLGDVLSLPGDDRLVTFSSNGRIDEVAADGTLRWRLSTTLGTAFGYTEVLEFD